MGWLSLEIGQEVCPTATTLLYLLAKVSCVFFFLLCDYGTPVIHYADLCAARPSEVSINSAGVGY